MRWSNTRYFQKKRTALIASVSKGHFAVSDFLLRVGADPSVQNAEGVDALMLACQLHGKSPNHSDLIQLLLLHGASTQNQDKKQQTALHFAARKGCHGAVKMLLGKSKKTDQLGPNINAIDSQGMTPLMYAALRGHVQIVNTLCSAAANVNLRDYGGSSALHYAARSGKKLMVDVILAKGTNLGAEDQYGLNPVKIAAALGRVDFVQELLNHGAVLLPWVRESNPMQSPRNTRSALVLAASNGHMDTLQLLLSHRIATKHDPEAIHAELAEADRVALLGCHDDIHRFISPILQQQQVVPLPKSTRFRKRCSCQTCKIVFAGDDGGSSLVSTNLTNGAASPETTQSQLILESGLVECMDTTSQTVAIQTHTEGASICSASSSVGGETGKPPTTPPNMNSGSDIVVDDDNEDEDDDNEDENKKNKSHKMEKRFKFNKVFDPNDLNVKSDIIRIIGAYLQEQGYDRTSRVLQEETDIKLQKRKEMNEKAQEIYDMISRGEWGNISKLTTKSMLGRNYRRFLYAIHKQNFLELISRGENERAFSFMQKRLKPLEAQSRSQPNKSEFADLCYLLVCKSVHDTVSFRNWDTDSARERLAEDFKSMVEYSTEDSSSSLVSRQGFVEKNRLIHLLQQAIAYQLEFSSVQDSGVTPKIDTLLDDFQSVAIPKLLQSTFVGHTYNVKCVKFLGDEGRLLASGSSDRTIMIWRVQEDFENDSSEDEDEEGDTAPSNSEARDIEESDRKNKQKGLEDNRVRQVKQRGPETVIYGHKSRIWDISSDRSGRWLTSASGDSTVRLWDIWSCLEEDSSSYIDPEDIRATSRNSNLGQKSIFNNYQSSTRVKFEDIETGHVGDIYGITFHVDQEHVATAGYDKTIRLVNVRSNQVVKTFQGHTAAVTDVKFNQSGNLIISTSKDSTVKFWDSISGVCVRTLTQPVGEVTSIDKSKDGLHILTASKDSSICLWDVRTSRVIQRFRGYQNSSLNFVRAVFGPREALVYSGSEDGKVHTWDTLTGKLLAKLRGHTGPVFHTVWNNSQSLLASCSADGTVRTWKA
mmetsp:Transcript_41601/g.66860  ORF Transcript_41601/g.66860 Transcript_41601/m.66860 type:complete len:1044 (+) Transcript_41601:193-3324(+)